jgi:putative ABC transport system ATP-binding protein
MPAHSTEPGAGGEVIRLAGVTKAYQAGVTPALADVSMTVTGGEAVAIMGPSGSGKSTLLNMIAGLDRPTSGAVTVAGQRIDRLGEGALARFRARHVGIVFQFFNLLDDLTVEDNVLLPAQLAGASRRAARARAAGLLAQMSIERFRNAYPARLSGGQRQRVAVARALVNSPELLLADEPTGALDTATGLEISRLLRQLNSGGQTLVLVTHDPALAQRQGARTVAIVDGQVAGRQAASAGRGAAG